MARSRATSAELTLAAFLFSLCLSIPLGILSAIRRFSWIDNLATFLALGKTLADLHPVPADRPGLVFVKGPVFPWQKLPGSSGVLGPDGNVDFSPIFSTPEPPGEGWAPQIQVNVVWMKSETRIEPQYNRTAPHPSALPLDRGGVGGVETREEIDL